MSDLAVDESDTRVIYVGTATSGIWKSHEPRHHLGGHLHGSVHVLDRGCDAGPLEPKRGLGRNGRAPEPPELSVGGRRVQVDGRGANGGSTRVYRRPAISRGSRSTHGTPTSRTSRLWATSGRKARSAASTKTIDGGDTWELVLYLDNHTGAIDLVMDPSDPNTLFAAMYSRRRTAWGFNGGGAGSGIYRTVDGGVSWTRLQEGLPEGELGRIGLDIFRRDGNVVFATVEARSGQTGLYGSTDRGDTWEKLSGTNPRPMYFSQIRVDPNDPKRVYVGGTNLMRSDDGGRTFTDDGARNVHLDHHALWIDPSDSNHLLLGSDGGVSTSFDRSETWRFYNNLPIAQFYEIGFDNRRPYWVCGGLQDNGTWCGPTNTLDSQGIRNADWQNVGGGDGFYVRIDPSRSDGPVLRIPERIHQTGPHRHG